MVQKYTIWKLLIQNLNKENRSVKGFTLLELVFGMLIAIVVGGLALNAFIQASNSFNQDKKNIDSNQKLSAILELIGNDVRQAGEQINDARFPVIEIEPDPNSTRTPPSSKITIRRSLSIALNLCDNSPLTGAMSVLTVADDSLALAGCNVGTLSTTALPATVSRPNALRQARDKRCQLDELDSTPNTDYCQGNAAESVMAVMSDGLGNIRTLRYTDDSQVSTTKYQISINNLSVSKPDPTATYASGSTPIYLIEESIYSLTNDGRLQVARNGSTTPETLVKGITAFSIAARVYGDKATKAPDPINAASPAVAPNLLPIARRCNTATPFYICNFNTYRPGGAGSLPVIDDWKTLQGVRVNIQAKYDPTGRSTTPSTEDLNKLTAEAEFFPRNVLSR
jgi:type II secretory pathway pseudopilin PulG